MYRSRRPGAAPVLATLLVVWAVSEGCTRPRIPDAPAPQAGRLPPVVHPNAPAEPIFEPAGPPVIEPVVPEVKLPEPLEILTGTASYYADRFHRRRTASGERYDRNELVAAHRSLPFGTLLRVTNLANDLVVLVRVIDRGPFVKGRVLDLSRRAAEELKFVGAGLAEVRIEVLDYGESRGRGDR